MGVRRFPNASYGPLELRPLLRARLDEDERPVAWGHAERDPGLLGVAAGILLFWFPFAMLLLLGGGSDGMLVITTRRLILLSDDRKAIDPESTPTLEAEIGTFTVVLTGGSSYEIHFAEGHEPKAFQFTVDESRYERLARVLRSLAEVEEGIEPQLGPEVSA